MFRAAARIAVVLGALGMSALARAAGPEPLILAVHPYLPATEVMTRFQPLADYLGRKLGQPVQVRVGRDYEEQIRAIGGDQVDIAFMGPASYVQLVATHGRKPLLARLEILGKPHLVGLIVTRRDSEVRSLADLQGKRFAFGDPHSTMSHVVPQYMLIRAGVPERALGRHEFLGAHKNVALAVLAGDYDAGALKQEIYEEYASRGLRQLAATPPISEHVFVTRSSLPPERIEALRRALLGLHREPDGTRIMQAINKDMTAMVPVTDGDYDNLRAILRTVETAGR